MGCDYPQCKCFIYITLCISFVSSELRTRAHHPVNMPVCASTGPVQGRCCQHRPITGPVPATNDMFTGHMPNTVYIASLLYLLMTWREYSQDIAGIVLLVLTAWRWIDPFDQKLKPCSKFGVYCTVYGTHRQYYTCRCHNSGCLQAIISKHKLEQAH